VFIDQTIKWLLPHENRFFMYLESIANSAGVAADVYAQFREAKSRDDFKKIADILRTKEHEADELAHTIYEELDKTFVTPIDREDLHSLTHALDDILDLMESAAEQIYLFKLPRLTEPMRDLIRLEREAVHEVVKCVKQLRHLDKIDEIRVHIIHVNSLENEADKVYRKALEALFDNMIDPIELIRQKEILDALEEAIDACEHVVNVIRSVVVKNG
jgi:predicted phosphate transport protein (TIGR00153 family)